MLSQKCSRCRQLKALDQYHTTPKGLTSRCISCLDLSKVHRAQQRTVELVKTIESLPTLLNFYSALEAAKEKEPLMHIIPFHSKPSLDNHSVQTVQISSIGNDNMPYMDPSSKEDMETFKLEAGRISHQCGDMCGGMY